MREYFTEIFARLQSRRDEITAGYIRPRHSLLIGPQPLKQKLIVAREFICACEDWLVRSREPHKVSRSLCRVEHPVCRLECRPGISRNVRPHVKRHHIVNVVYHIFLISDAFYESFRDWNTLGLMTVCVDAAVFLSPGSRHDLAEVVDQRQKHKAERIGDPVP